jgi:shikimate dehydrogenase
LKEAEEMGCKTLNGVGMFINQGAEAFKLWTGIEAPTEKMSKIVHKIIEEN